MSQFRHQTRRLLGDTADPKTLWVIRSPRVEGMYGLDGTPQIDLGQHYDWLLAAGSDHLGLVRLRGPRLRQDDLVFNRPFDSLRFSFVDRGGETPARDLMIVADDGGWFVVTAHLTRNRVNWVSEFTDLLRVRTS